jgi:hypothetical protein
VCNALSYACPTPQQVHHRAKQHVDYIRCPGRNESFSSPCHAIRPDAGAATPFGACPTCRWRCDSIVRWACVVCTVRKTHDRLVVHRQQVVSNYVSNALKFTPVGGTVTVTLEILSTTFADVTLRVSVRDTGIGINQATIDTLFSEYVQVCSVSGGQVLLCGNPTRVRCIRQTW